MATAAPTARTTPARKPASTRRRLAIGAAFAAPLAMLASQLTLPAYADTTVAPVVVAATVAEPVAAAQTFTVGTSTAVDTSRDAYSIKAPPPPPPKPAPTPVAATTKSVASTAVTGAAKPAAAPAPVVAVVPAGEAQQIAAQMVAARGWGDDQFSCLVSLWNKESGWRVTAMNPSGAYGIPQAYPGSKMASAGADWQTSAATQITWGLGYIAGRYGTPCAAWQNSVLHNSY